MNDSENENKSEAPLLDTFNLNKNICKAKAFCPVACSAADNCKFFLVDEKTMINLRVCTFLGFFFLVAASIPQSITDTYLKVMHVSPENVGLVMSITSLSSLFGTLLINFFLSLSFKATFIGCNLIAATNFICYAWAGHFDSFALMFVGRVIYGFGNSKVAARRYILGHAPISKVRKFSMEFTALSAIGSGVGPLINALIYLSLPGNQISPSLFDVNKFSIAGYTAAGFMLVHLLIILFLFEYDVEPEEDPKLEEEEEEKEQVEEEKVQVEDEKGEEDSINWLHLSVLLGMFFFTEAGIEILFVFFPYFNNNVANNFFEENYVNLIIGLSNLLVFGVIILIQTKSSNTEITKLMIIFCSLALISSVMMGNFFYVQMWQFTCGFLALIISLNMVESNLKTSFAERPDRDADDEEN